MEKALAYAREHREEALRDLQELIRFASISTYGANMTPCAERTREMMEAAGLTAEIHDDGSGFPVIVGRASGERKTLLFYNHYDVQPADPLDAWNYDPFGAEVADGRIWGRGACDMKGGLVGRLWALKSWMKAEGSLPVNVVFLVEGEEETGSAHLDGFVRDHADLLKSDACVWEPGGIAAGQAEIVCGCKGALVLELTCREGRQDLHSASAAVLESAPWRLVKALSTLRDDETGQCIMDGYLDAVRPPSEKDIELCEKTDDPSRLAEDLRSMGRDGWHRSLKGGKGVSLAGCFLPTCNIQGIYAGHAGKGMKNVLPFEAKAKLDFRLVADQTTGETLANLRKHLDRRGYGDIEIEVYAAVEPSRSSISDPLVAAMAKSGRETFGGEALISPSMGGFGPMHAISRHLGIATIIGGDYQRPGGGAHAPNEHLWVEDYYLGIESVIRLLKAYGEG